MFKSIGESNRVDLIVKQIMNAIKDGKYGEGEKLPPERELSKQLGVSRSCIRESLRTLQTAGVVEILHGKGTFVKEDPSKIFDTTMWRSWLAAYRDDVIDLLNVRAALESKAMDLAAQSSLDQWEELEADLEEVLSQMEEAVSNENIERLAELDIKFHEQLSLLAGNRFLTNLLNSITNILHEERRAVLEMPARAQISLKQHYRIFHAVKNKDRMKVRRSLLEHIESVKEQIVSQTGEEYKEKEK